MIFRAPAGHWLLNKKELNTLLEHTTSGNEKKAKEYLEFCLEELNFYDDVRRKVEEKKMLQEDGELFKAQSLENKLRERVRQRVERSKLFKDSFLV